MGKFVGNYDHNRILELKRRVRDNMKRTMEALRKISDPVELFRQMKFDGIGYSPLGSAGERENLVEQINQSFTILMSCYAAEKYFPEAKSFDFALASARGRDMVVYGESRIIAEVEIFTAVNAGNNRKLRRDVDRLCRADIPGNVKRMVCYSAASECELKNPPENVSVNYCSPADLIKWINE